MTREEIIEYLKAIAQYYSQDYSDPYVEFESLTDEELVALDMAIKIVKQEPILDKIRAEIEQLRLHKAEFLTSDNKVCIDSQAVLDIIDKYKAESEDKE